MKKTICKECKYYSTSGSVPTTKRWCCKRGASVKPMKQCKDFAK